MCRKPSGARSICDRAFGGVKVPRRVVPWLVRGGRSLRAISWRVFATGKGSSLSANAIAESFQSSSHKACQA